MHNKKIEMTQEGYEKCKQELLKLQLEKRPQIVNDLRIAYDYGDLRENSEFDSAKDALKQCDDRIKVLESMLHKAKIINNKSTPKITVGTTITVQYLEDLSTEELKLVSPIELNPLENTVSNQSPVGKALEGKKINNIVTITTPTSSYKVKIIDLKQN